MLVDSRRGFTLSEPVWRTVARFFAFSSCTFWPRASNIEPPPSVICTFVVSFSLICGAVVICSFRMIAIGRRTFSPVHSPKTFWYSVFTSKTTTWPWSPMLGRGFERISPPKRIFGSAGSSMSSYSVGTESATPGRRSLGTMR